MIEERVTVERLDAGHAWVVAGSREGCPRCEAGQGCGGGVLGKMTRQKVRRVRVRNPLTNLRIGDAVIIGLDESALMTASIVMYLVPLLLMLAGGSVGDIFGPHPSLTFLGAATGFALGLGILRRYNDNARNDERYEPVILRIAGSEGCSSVVQPGVEPGPFGRF